MKTALYKGQVGHVRLRPFRHAFGYRLYMTCIDLDAWPSIEANVGSLWSRMSGVRLRRADHLGDPHRPLATSVRALVSEQIANVDIGRVLLLTHLGQFGYRFNPVSFYFCYATIDPNDLHAIVLEVNNTPWGEQHSYVLDCRNQGTTLEFRLPKRFHVSPFLPMDMDYHFKFVLSGDDIEVIKENYQNSNLVFSATLRLRASELTRTSLAHALVEFPLMTLKIVLSIYWQALRLFLKGARYYPHHAQSNSSASQAVGYFGATDPSASLKREQIP